MKEGLGWGQRSRQLSRRVALAPKEDKQVLKFYGENKSVFKMKRVGSKQSRDQNILNKVERGIRFYIKMAQKISFSHQNGKTC